MELNEASRKKESEFKDSCRKEAERMKAEIRWVGWWWCQASARAVMRVSVFFKGLAVLRSIAMSAQGGASL